ncbi:Uncharacterised protein [Vibrio cholerae]|nr:Uncharacterised protein [Vibrio cholerae]CSI87431.1 Uncharacterised protein [Vibrio cholerae]
MQRIHHQITQRGSQSIGITQQHGLFTFDFLTVIDLIIFQRRFDHRHKFGGQIANREGHHHLVIATFGKKQHVVYLLFQIVQSVNQLTLKTLTSSRR